MHIKFSNQNKSIIFPFHLTLHPGSQQELVTREFPSPQLRNGDLAMGSVSTVVTSPPVMRLVRSVLLRTDWISFMHEQASSSLTRKMMDESHWPGPG